MYINSKNNLTEGGISVIVPVYNGEKYIKNCLDMLLNQDGENFEVIVINDGSTDNTADIVKSIRDEKLVYLEQENKGVSAARNKGMELSRGDWIVFCDVDDEIKQGYIKDINNIINTYPDYQMFVFAKYNAPKGEDENFEISKDNALINFFSENNKEFSEFHICSVWSKVYSKKLLLDYNIKFNSKISFGEDILFVLNVYAVIDKFKLIRHGYYNYVQNAGSAVYSSGKESDKEGFLVFIDGVSDLIKNYPEVFKDKQILFGLNKFLLVHTEYVISRVLRSMQANRKSVYSRMSAMNEILNGLNNFLVFIKGNIGFDKHGLKLRLAKACPKLYVNILEKKYS